MEVEPLQDSLPDRYAIESDDSEDDVGQNAYPGAQTKPQRTKSVYSADFVWNGEGGRLSGQETYVAIGQAGLIWASGIQLNSPIAELRLKEEKVAQVHSVEGDKVVVVLQYDLPIGAMHTFASKVLKTLQPKSLTIVDAYSSPAYISSKQHLDPPIRYLQTRASTAKPSRQFSRFLPPNLLLSPSAAVFNILEIEGKVPGLLVLLPLPSIERPPPSSLQPTSISVSWPESQIMELHRTIFPEREWDGALAKSSGQTTLAQKAKKRLSKDVDMSMYI